MIHDMDRKKRETAEVTPDVRKLLSRIGNGQAIELTEDGVVVGRLERVEPAADPFDRSRVRAVLQGLEELRADLAHPLTAVEIERAISEGRV